MQGISANSATALPAISPYYAAYNRVTGHFTQFWAAPVAPEKDAFVGRVRQVGRQVAPYALAGLGGVGLAGGSAVLASLTINPFLLQLVAPIEVGLLSVLPVVGPALAVVIGTHVFSWLASACLLAAVVGTLTTPRQQRGMLPWCLAHVCLGFALSPLLGAGTAAGVVPWVLLGAGALTLSFVLSSRLLHGQATWQLAIAGLTLALALGPVGAQLALSGNAQLACTHLLGICAGGVALSAMYRLYNDWPRLVAKQTAYLENFLIPQEDIQAARLDLPGEMRPNLFGTSPQVVALVNVCRRYIAYKQPIGMLRCLLSGTSGGGKTEMARGMAHALQANLVVVHPALLSSVAGGYASPAANVVEIFTQARQLQHTTKRLVILFFDEAETLFPQRTEVLRGDATAHERNQLVTTFLTCFEGALKPPDDNLVILAATNHPERFDPAMLNRFSYKIELKSPDVTQLAAMFRAHLQQALEQEPLWRPYASMRLPEPFVIDLARQAVAQGWVPRDVANLMVAIKLRLGNMLPPEPATTPCVLQQLTKTITSALANYQPAAARHRAAVR